MDRELKKHRVIGIRHALKSFKEAGLIDDDSVYPEQAVDNVQIEILSAAKRWYRIGAKRGANEILNAIIDGKFTVGKTKSVDIEISAHVDSVTWERELNVTVGNDKQHVGKRTYTLTLKDLEFDV